MITGIVQDLESVRKGVTLKIDIDDKVRPDDIATWQDEAVILTNGKSIISGRLWKIRTTTDECVRLSVDIPRDEYPENIFTWKHEKILIKKENENGDAETDSQKNITSKEKRRREVKRRAKGRAGTSKKMAAAI